MRRLWLGAATALFSAICVLCLPGSGRANLLLNPSFETGAGSLPNSCGADCTYSAEGNAYGNCCNNDSTTIPDWTISAFTQGAGVIAPGTSALGSPYGYLSPLPDGNAAAYTSGGSIFQTIAPTVVAGDTYTLSAWIAPAYNQCVQSAYGFGYDTGLGQTLLDTSATGLTSGDWTQVSGSFTA